MKKLCSIIAGVLLALPITAQMPERTPENVAKYKEICRKHIYKDMKGMYREAGGRTEISFPCPREQPVSGYAVGLGLVAEQHCPAADSARKRPRERPPRSTQI